MKVKILPDTDMYFQVGSSMEDCDKIKMLLFLIQNVDVFAWSPYKIPGVDPEFIVHKLNMDLSFPHEKQKLKEIGQGTCRGRNVGSTEVKGSWNNKGNLFSGMASEYCDSEEKNGKWRVSIDFTNLNRACPKDLFPMPKIDQLVNATYGHPRMSFLDTFQGYHQIVPAPEDREKTAFISPYANYHYTIMPFGLKNARAIYQRMMTRMFRDKIGHTVEVYIDDMVVKSKQKGRLIEDL